jgi:hypothetical protein
MKAQKLSPFPTIGVLNQGFSLAEREVLMLWIEGTEVERLTRKEERGRKGMNIGGEQPASRFSRIRLILVETRGIGEFFRKDEYKKSD